MSCAECGQHYARSEEGCCPHCHFKPKPAETTAATAEPPAATGAAAASSAAAPEAVPEPRPDGAREFERRGCLGLSVVLMTVTAGAVGLWVAERLAG